jgi:hypothetical protein
LEYSIQDSTPVSHVTRSKAMKNSFNDAIMNHTGPLALGYILESSLNWNSSEFMQIYIVTNPLYAKRRKDVTYIITHYPPSSESIPRDSNLFKNIIIYRGLTIGNIIDNPSHLIHGRSHHWQ